MQPGPLLDQAIAQHLFNSSTLDQPAPPYSTDLTTAWEVVDRLCDQGYTLQLSGTRAWKARFYKSVSHTLETKAFEATFRAPAAALCIAALRVYGIIGPA